MNTHMLTGTVVDVIAGKMFPAKVSIVDGKIAAVTPTNEPVEKQFILPGFIDSHVHVESSMLIPSEFARLAVVQGTVATVSDPHEIANVLGIKGVRYMVANGKKVPFHFYFGAPSCVPATAFETAGAAISCDEIRTLFTEDGLLYLSEMMNYPGVLARAPDVMEKIAAAKSLGLPVDGHAPGLKGKDAERYITAGISTDHECYTLEEALDKVKYGMMISIREGSAAKNYDALHPLLKLHPEKVMFSSDDKHPNDLAVGHINDLVRRSIVDHGYDTMDVLRAACYNPVKHYSLDVGLLRVGDSADCIVVDSLTKFTVLQTYVKGICVAKRGRSLIESVQEEAINNFQVEKKALSAFALPATGTTIQVIKAEDGQLITQKETARPKVVDGFLVSDPDQDLLKIAVVNRYQNAPVRVAFIRGFGLKKGALASCIAHDSHNIIAVGVDDADIMQAVNSVIEAKGGIAAVSQEGVAVLALPVGGIMTTLDGYKVAASYSAIDQKAKALGTTLTAPFMTLSFMALLVIPSLKLSDKGLFDGDTFTFTELQK